MTTPPAAGLRLWHLHHYLESVASRSLCFQPVRQFGMFVTESITMKVNPFRKTSVMEGERHRVPVVSDEMSMLQVADTAYKA